MLHLTERLLKVEDEFLDALGDGEGAMRAFESRWEKLLEDVDVVAGSPAGLDCDTASLVHTIALRVAALAEASTAIVTDYEAITSQLMNDIDSLMSELTLCDFPPALPANTLRPLSLDGSSTRMGSAEPTRPCRKRRRHSATTSPTGIKRPRLASDTVEQRHEPRSPVHRTRWRSLPLSPSPSPTVNSRSSVMDHATVPPIAKPTSRKRRLSDADLFVLPQPKRLHAGPRLHAVSDSFLPSNTSTPLFLLSKPSSTEATSTVDLQHIPLVGMLDIQPLIGSVDMDPTMRLPPTVVPSLEETDCSQPISSDIDELLQSWLYSTQIPRASVSVDNDMSYVHSALGAGSPSTPAYTWPVSPRSPSSTASTPPPSTPPSLHTTLASSSPVHHLDPLFISSSFASLTDSPLSYRSDPDPFWSCTPQTAEHSVMRPFAESAWCSKLFTCEALDVSRPFVETFDSIFVNGCVGPNHAESVCEEKISEAIHARNSVLVI